jgi:hypothetical protein
MKQQSAVKCFELPIADFQAKVVAEPKQTQEVTEMPD